MLTLPPLSLYIHVPWCVRKCPYCDFNSHEFSSGAVADASLPEQEYVAALLDDLKHDLKYVQGREIISIFIGGGTPSLLSAKAYEQLFEGLQKHLSFSHDIEITLEANPGTAERNKFADYRALGINRLSLGVQSFSADQLKKLGRIHDPDDARRAIEFARKAGFSRLNVDLMYALEQQSSAQALDDLQQAIAFQPEHISWYQLTVEPNTAFYKNPPQQPEEDALIDMQDAGLALLADRGFQRYEVSAFARAGEASRHNVNYWQFGDYLGIGAGAHAKLTQPHRQRILRLRKRRQPAHYLQAARHSLTQAQTNLANRYPYLADAAPVESEQLPLEFLLNALRLRDGFSREQFEQRTGLPFAVLSKQVESLQQQQLLAVDGASIRTTDKGYQFLNSVLEAFL
ncbi:radical SAM family heme chaperone HemW [Pseudohongiella spirulinae]|uniref:Heme chaperone HemW n=1 Tax=Pseudohongiella spirulinae TaxID=1249552 RepID=A0A0S2K941_9GAMM|nr:radical SAM family heme chaperone HemW [Pseudohongiella spirulinae]ALO44848.1 HemN family oxidoreductase [Pseudohongiella spirulinae]